MLLRNDQSGDATVLLAIVFMVHCSHNLHSAVDGMPAMQIRYRSCFKLKRQPRNDGSRGS